MKQKEGVRMALLESPHSMRRFFYEAVLSLQNTEECEAFFSDVCTENEVRTFAQRFAVASLLREGCTYQQIEAQTGASPAQISRVKRCMQQGNQGMTLALSRLKQEGERDG